MIAFILLMLVVGGGGGLLAAALAASATARRPVALAGQTATEGDETMSRSTASSNEPGRGLDPAPGVRPPGMDRDSVVLEGDSGSSGVGRNDAEAQDRTSINVSKQALGLLTRLSEATGIPVKTLATEAIECFIELAADLKADARGEQRVIPSETYNQLKRQSMVLGVHPGYLMRAGTAISTRLAREMVPATARRGSETVTLFKAIYDRAVKTGRTVAGVIAEVCAEKLARSDG